MYLGSNVEFSDSLEPCAEMGLHREGPALACPSPLPSSGFCALSAAHPPSARAPACTHVGILSRMSKLCGNTHTLATCQVHGVPPVMWSVFGKADLGKMPVFALEVSLGLSINGDTQPLGPENSLHDGRGCGWRRARAEVR